MPGSTTLSNECQKSMSTYNVNMKGDVYMAKVLVIEDNENLRFLFEGFLTDAGHNVVLAESGAQGLETLLTDPLPDVILLDLIMPDMDGSTVAKNLYMDDRLSKIPIIVISGAATFINPIPNIYSRYITKPFDLDDVLGAIDEFTGSKMIIKDEA